ncbi:integrase, catalytic region, zinc finger, CCHC-type containing protein [Tanacetum coccineum]
MYEILLSLIAQGMFKLDLQPLSSKLKKNREAHVDYLKQTKEHADTLHEIRFVSLFRFRNDQVAAIMGYGDYQIGNVTISKVYYVEGLGHNLFSVGQLCNSDLEIAFHKHSCFVRDLEGVDLLKGSRGTNLYTISLEDMLKFSRICLLSKASKTTSWLWHRRLSHLNFGTINQLLKSVSLEYTPRILIPLHPNGVVTIEQEPSFEHVGFEDSTVTYTEISSPYEDLSDVGSPGAEGPIFQDPPSPDYVPGPEEPEQAPPSPIYIPFVPEPVYPEFLPVDDEVFPAEEQPMPAADSPTHQSPGYIPESDPEEDPEEDDEEDPEEDPADYPADRGDDRDDEEPSDDDDDDDAEEEEHLAPADPAAVAYSADQDPYLAYRVTARMSIRPQAPAPFLSEEVAERLLALPTPPPSPLSPYSSPLPQIPSPPLPIPPPPPNWGWPSHI